MNFEQAVTDYTDSFRRLSEAAEGGSAIVFKAADLEHAQITVDYCDAIDAEGLLAPYGLKEHAAATIAHYTTSS